MPQQGSSVRILVGTAPAATIGRLAAAYAAAGRDLPSQLWLVPDAAPLAATQQLLLEATGGCLAPGLRTLAQWAEALVAADPEARAVLPRVQTRQLIERSLDELAAAGKLPLLDEVRQRGGLVDTVEALVADAKSHGVTPQRMKKWAGSTQRRAKDRELALIFGDYQRRLDQGGWADHADRYAQALAALERQPSLRWTLAVVSDFDRMAWDAWQLVAELLRRSQRALVSLLGEAESQRQDLWADPAQLRELIVGTFPSSSVEYLTSPSGSWSDNLFAPLAAHPPAADGTLELLTAATPQDEWRQVARHIKSKLLMGKAADTIVVAAATLPGDRDRAAQVLGEYGIPFSLEPAPVAASCPALGTLLDVLRVADEDWPFEALVRLVNNRRLALFAGPALPDSPFATVRAATEWTLRDLQIVAGRDEVSREVAARATAAQAAGERSPRQWAALDAHEALAGLATALEKLPSEATASEWIATLEQLATDTGLTLRGEAWDVSRETLWWTAHADAAAQWSLSQMLQLLTDAAYTQSLSATSDRAGRVRVMPLRSAARVPCDHLVLVGMVEDALSGRTSASQLYAPSDWQKMGGGPAPAERYHQQMLLFYRLVTQPRESLTISYTALDDKAQRVHASPYVDELSRAAGGVLDGKLHDEPSVRVVRDERPLSLRELRICAMVRGERGEADELAALASLGVGQHLLRTLDVQHDRSHGDTFGPFEGVVKSPELVARLSERYNTDYQWSVSALETYATCGFQFLAKNLLRLSPISDIELATDYARRGQIAHDVLWHLHREAPTLRDADHCAEALATSITNAVATQPSSGREGTLVRIEAQQVAGWAEQYFEQLTTYNASHAKLGVAQAPQPMHLEWRFGQTSRATVDQNEDSRSVDTAFELEVDGEVFRFGGRIDRIDVGQFGEVTVFNVIDYKMSAKSPFDPDEAKAGRQLQLPIYACAAAELLLGGHDQAKPLAAGYWVLRKNGFHEKNCLAMHSVAAAEVVPVASWEEIYSDIRQRVRALVHGIRGGEFPMNSPDDDCTRTCDYSRVCRIAQVRAMGKVWPPVGKQPAEAPR